MIRNFSLFFTLALAVASFSLSTIHAGQAESELLNAATVGNLQVVEQILQDKVDVNAAGDGGITPLLMVSQMAALEPFNEDYIKVINALIRAGADLSLECNKGYSPLALASEGSVEAVKVLLAAGADANGGTADSPLSAAVSSNKLAIVSELLAGGALDKGNTLLHKAVGIGSSGILEALIAAGGNVKDADQSGTPLFLSIATPQFKGLPDAEKIAILEILHKNGADINRSNNEGKSAFFIVAENGDSSNDYIGWFVKNGADINHKDQNWETPLFVAARKGRIVVAKLLVGHGADVNAKNALGLTPLDIATDPNDPHSYTAVVIRALGGVTTR